MKQTTCILNNLTLSKENLRSDQDFAKINQGNFLFGYQTNATQDL